MTEELFHVRCIGCGRPFFKVLQFQELLEQKYTIGEALDKLGYTRYCCRMWMMSPFKTLMTTGDQKDIETMVITKKLTTAPTEPHDLISPLQALNIDQDKKTPTLAYTIIPETATDAPTIELPPIVIPDTTGNMTYKQMKKTNRFYEDLC